MANAARTAPVAGAPATAGLIRLTAARIQGVDLMAEFWLAKGQTAVIYGPPGSGKSRLLEVLRLARAPEAGALTAFGQPTGALRGDALAETRRRIGSVTQTPRFLEHLSAAQNVALPLMLAGQRARDYSRNVDELLAYVGLSSTDERPMSALNETSRRRTAIARAMVGAPNLIIADEPTAGVAPDQALRLLRVLGSMNQVGAGLIVATQMPDVADTLGAPVWRIADGRLWPPEHSA